MDRLGIKATILDARGDPIAQINQMTDLIAKNPDVIILWPADAKALIP